MLPNFFKQKRWKQPKTGLLPSFLFAKAIASLV